MTEGRYVYREPTGASQPKMQLSRRIMVCFIALAANAGAVLSDNGFEYAAEAFPNPVTIRRPKLPSSPCHRRRWSLLKKAASSASFTSISRTARIRPRFGRHKDRVAVQAGFCISLPRNPADITPARREGKPEAGFSVSEYLRQTV